MARGYKPTYRRAPNRKSAFSFATGKLVAACAVLALVGMGAHLALAAPDGEGRQRTGLFSPSKPKATDESRVSFVAVGDNLPDDVIGTYADSQSGETGDGLYDYRPIYRAIKPYIQKADLAYINFETHAGGDEIGPRGWPSFNTTDAMVDAICDTGFNLIASATNHSYDWGQEAIEHSIALWKDKPVVYAGTALTPEEAYSIKPFEKNGIVFTFLNYTYGINGYDEADIPSHTVNYATEDRVRGDLAQARALSDIVIVAMHWGTENQSEPDEGQLYWAQLLADGGADLVLGSHPHVIGPLAWVEGAGGNRTLVAYSLGDFLSRYDTPNPINELEGMLRCDFVKSADGTRIEKIHWTPLVNHSEEGNYRIYALKDYTPSLAARHRAFEDLPNPISWLKEADAQIVGSEFRVDLSVDM
ncbi:MAG: CapA family protein [Coriobacteriaceae bacterium]|nr:CapA family protein [Coriobacteriaceae bacterium]